MPAIARQWLAALACVCLLATPPAFVGGQTVQPASAVAVSTAKTWLGNSEAIEAHLRTAEVTSIEDIGTGVTHPRRAYLKPGGLIESFTWKPLAPGRRGGYWESYKSEIAAYELDKRLALNMVPPVVEREVDGERGAAEIGRAHV